MVLMHVDDARGASAAWGFDSDLPWPGVRGRGLWERLVADRRGPRNDAGEVRYEVELCVPAAGHIALVLVRQQRPQREAAAATSRTPTDEAPGSASGPPRHASVPTVPAVAQLAVSRVVYVVDAVPPKRRGVSGAQRGNGRGDTQGSFTMLTTRAHSFGGVSSDPMTPTAAPIPGSEPLSNDEAPAAAAVGSTRRRGVGGSGSGSGSPDAVDELELIEELFTTTRPTKDQSLLAKAPLLCARFDCRVVAVHFFPTTTVAAPCASISTSASSTATTAPGSSSSAAPAALRCVVAREDGMCYLWEWGADLHQWTFLNRFCVLDNPNLKWTRPLRALAVVPVDAGTSELVWWSAEVPGAPRLWARKLQFATERRTFRTELCLGGALPLLPRLFPVASASSAASTTTTATTTTTTTDAAAATAPLGLWGSNRGLWVLSAAHGVHFRGRRSLTPETLPWSAIRGPPGASSAVATATSAMARIGKEEEETVVARGDVCACVHNVTGELVLLWRPTGALFVVSSSSSVCSSTAAPSSGSALRLRQRATLPASAPRIDADQDDDDENDSNDLVRSGGGIEAIAAHRELLVTIQCGPRVPACVIYSLVSGLELTRVELPSDSGLSPTSWALWTTTGRASGVGLWSRGGLWRLRTPSAQALARAHAPADEGLAVARAYGTTMQFEAARRALEVLRGSSGRRCPAAAALIAQAALLLAAIPPDKHAPAGLLEELTRLVASLQRTTHEIVVTGRFAAALDQRDPAALDGLGRLTPANLETLHHLANWVLLAKRKLTHLETSGALKARGKQQQQPQQQQHHPTPGATPPQSQHPRTRTMSSLTTFSTDDDDDDDDADGDNHDLDDNGSRDADVPLFGPLETDPEDASSSRASRKLRPMSSLQFAAGGYSRRHGREWLAQLERLLLDGVRLVPPVSSDPDATHAAVPSHLLFHEERRLVDFQAALSSFSKHMYFEAMCRLYLLHRPQDLVPFVQYIAEHCPRLFSLSPDANLQRRTHAERALMLLPPIHSCVDRVRAERIRSQRPRRSSSGSGSHRRRRPLRESGLAGAQDVLLAYADVLCLCGKALEATHALLAAGLYEECIQRIFERELNEESAAVADGDAAGPDEGRTLQGAVYFALVEHCVKHREALDLEHLLRRKPPHVEPLVVLKVLRRLLPMKVDRTSPNVGTTPATRGRITVGQLRGVLTALVQEHQGKATTPQAPRPPVPGSL